MSRKSRKGIGSRRTNAVRRTLDRTRMLETLEPKQMLAGDPIISEFQATNASTIQDGNGDYSDWIEITNRSSDPMNLVGWYLTDDANDLTQWQFPDLQLPGNDQVLVFASGDDAPDAAGNVHTNFRLSGGGEYLALVKPDGTIAQEFAPEYPEQFEDQSYGIAVGRDNAVLIPDDAPIKAFVPTNDSLGTTWTSTTFNDASWSSGNGAVGYEVLQSGFNVRDEFNSLGGDWTVDIPAGGTSTAAVESGRLRLTVPADQPLVGDESRGLGPVVYRSVPNNPSDFSVITHVETGASRGGAGIALYDATTGRVALQLQYSSRLYFRLINGDNEVLGQRVSVGRDSYFLRLERDSANQAWNAYFKINEADEWTLIDTVVDGTENFPGVTDLRVGPSGNTESDDVTAYFLDFFEKTLIRLTNHRWPVPRLV
ncbi:MAG: lamin tail domain-containing protein [Pirellulaceae bacterium]